DLRLDIGRVGDAFIRSDWKSATVLAGSVMEALLLWAILNRDDGDWQNAAVCAKISKWTKDRKPPEHWLLEDYINVVSELDILQEDTITECRLAQGFRNLIHPGRQKRLEMKCDKGTALLTEAALEHVVRDLTETESKRTAIDG